MAQNLNVLLASASSMKLNYLEDALADQQGLTSQRKLLGTAGVDSSDGSSAPDIIVFETHENWDREFGALVDFSSSLPMVPFIVIGEESDASRMRQAMKAGARDFFTHPVEEEELLDSIRTIGLETQLARRSGVGTLTAVINGKGGCGASVVAANLATSLSTRNLKKANGAVSEIKKVLLVDLNLLFGTLPVYFDLPSSDNLVKAIQGGGQMDSVALDGLLQVHNSGVRLLSNSSDSIYSLSDIHPNDVVVLLEQMCRYFDHVILDLPNGVDQLSASVVELCEQILITTRQSVPAIRDSIHLAALLNDIGVSKSSMHVIVNQFNKKAEIKLHDMRESFEGYSLSVLPEDSKHLDFAVNNGIPISVKWPKSPFAKAISELSLKIWPIEKAKARKGLFS